MLESNTIAAARALLRVRARLYWAMIKALQTALLVITGLAGYKSGRPTVTWPDILALLGSLFLSVAGSTVLNMVLDRDLDAHMARTRRRPLPSGRLSVTEGLILGLVLVFVGVAWAAHTAPLYGLVILAGAFFDVIVYTWWLKRRTCWSIVWGGIAGGMPVLAGRVLATGKIDFTGILLALAVLLWIPTHVVTFSIKYAADYRAAHIPVFPNRYGIRITRWLIALSTAAATVLMLWAIYRVGVSPAMLWAARGLGGLLCGFTIVSMTHLTPRLTMMLYRLASLYMLGSMLVLIVGTTH